MKLIYCIIWGKYRKFKTNKIFEEEESIKVIKVLGLIKNI